MNNNQVSINTKDLTKNEIEELLGLTNNICEAHSQLERAKDALKLHLSARDSWIAQKAQEQANKPTETT